MKAKTKIQDLQVPEIEELTDFEVASVVGGLSASVVVGDPATIENAVNVYNTLVAIIRDVTRT